jgi:hypothetical protein
MPTTTQIPTTTILNVVGSSISILTKYIDPNLGDVLQAFIVETVGGETVDGVNFIEGEGGITKPASSSLIASVDGSGNLILTSSDSSQYSVDSITGQLVYTY